jgi:hypothetical protein
MDRDDGGRVDARAAVAEEGKRAFGTQRTAERVATVHEVSKGVDQWIVRPAFEGRKREKLERQCLGVELAQQGFAQQVTKVLGVVDRHQLQEQTMQPDRQGFVLARARNEMDEPVALDRKLAAQDADLILDQRHRALDAVRYLDGTQHLGVTGKEVRMGDEIVDDLSFRVERLVRAVFGLIHHVRPLIVRSRPRRPGRPVQSSRQDAQGHAIRSSTHRRAARPEPARRAVRADVR